MECSVNFDGDLQKAGHIKVPGRDLFWGIVRIRAIPHIYVTEKEVLP